MDIKFIDYSSRFLGVFLYVPVFTILVFLESMHPVKKVQESFKHQLEEYKIHLLEE